MAAFVVEDETQDGPDHVDVHRAPVFIASPMWPAFQSKADLRSFTARPADVDLDHGSEKSGEMRLEVADSADDREYNEIIWKAVRGEASPLPPRKVGAFVKSRD